MSSFTLTDFDFHLPSDLIAKYPLEKRSSSRLLCLDRKTGNIAHRQFQDILSFFSKDDLLICNNTKVIPARLLGFKASGGRVEVLVERILDDRTVLAHVRASKSPKPGSILFLGVNVEVLGRQDDLFLLRTGKSFLDLIEAFGEVPIPPYFARKAEEIDKERYQTIYAVHKGSVAAPTAGLHFDVPLLEALKDKGVNIEHLTLHVGAGTFAPVRVTNITEHRMHKEYVEIKPELVQKIKDTKARGGRIIAVGTTTTRSLETASREGEIKPFQGETDIFIYPGFEFKCIDAMITNFHLPASTLLMLVSAFGGYENIRKAYIEAVGARYRFYSYGDAMYIG